MGSSPCLAPQMRCCPSRHGLAGIHSAKVSHCLADDEEKHIDNSAGRDNTGSPEPRSSSAKHEDIGEEFLIEHICRLQRALCMSKAKAISATRHMRAMTLNKVSVPSIGLLSWGVAEAPLSGPSTWSWSPKGVFCRGGRGVTARGGTVLRTSQHFSALFWPFRIRNLILKISENL